MEKKTKYKERIGQVDSQGELDKIKTVTIYKDYILFPEINHSKQLYHTNHKFLPILIEVYTGVIRYIPVGF